MVLYTVTSRFIWFYFQKTIPTIFIEIVIFNKYLYNIKNNKKKHLIKIYSF